MFGSLFPKANAKSYLVIYQINLQGYVKTALDIAAEIISPFKCMQFVFSLRTFYPSYSILVMKTILEVMFKFTFPNASYSTL